MKTTELALIGAGNRGRGIFGQYSLDMPHRCRFTAVVEPDEAKRNQFAGQHAIPQERCFERHEDLFATCGDDLDGVVIATLEDQRLEPLLAALASGCHVLIEKPLCTTPQDLVRLTDACKGRDEIVIVCHQMRLTARYRTLKELLDSGRYGELICIQHSENLSYSHMAHSFVRGVFNNSRLTPMLLAKSCHDMDILTHWMPGRPVRVASFGSLTYFKPDNAPKGAPKRCLDGCPHAASCPYHVLKLYFEEDSDQAYLRQMGVVRDKSHLRDLLAENRFGRCVFHCDNDVVDHQTVQVEFDSGAIVNFTMCGHNGVERRITKMSMTNGELECGHSRGELLAHSFEPLRTERYEVADRGTHHGGDRAIMDNFIDAIETGDRSLLLTPIEDSFYGHLLVFAAEESRRTGTVVDISAYEGSL
jgi:predicted dehydrogenase